MLVIYLFLDEKEKYNKNQHQFMLRHFYQKLHLQETQTMLSKVARSSKNLWNYSFKDFEKIWLLSTLDSKESQ